MQMVITIAIVTPGVMGRGYPPDPTGMLRMDLLKPWGILGSKPHWAPRF